MTDQTPELLFTCLECEQHFNVQKATTHCPVCGWSARPTPAERPVGSLTLAEQAIERQKVLGDPTGHVDALAADLVFAGETEYVERPVPQVREAELPFLCPQCGARGSTDGKASTFRWSPELTARPSDTAVAWRWRYKDSKGDWDYSGSYPKFASFNEDSMDCEPLYSDICGKTTREALDNSNSLFAAMLHEKRPDEEIEKQIYENRRALALPPDEPARAKETS